MEIKEWIMLAPASIVVIGWFVTGYLNRVKDVAQKRLEYRLKMLESFLPVCFSIQKHRDKNLPSQPDFLEQLEDARSKFQLFGLKDEIDLMEQFIAAMAKQNLPEAIRLLES